MILRDGALWLRMLLLAGIALILFLPGFTSLPVTDRDEARFAQASRQMMESGDFITPRVQDEPRYKKPIGIYWLQNAALHLAGQDADAGIWAYRLPSLFGAAAAVLLVAFAGGPLVGRDQALLAALLLAVCLVLGGEARLAKTDAALLATALLAQLALARFWLGIGGRGWAYLFWLATALAVLIKGPIVPLLSGLTVVTLVIWERRADWLRPLWSAIPILLAVAIISPWFLAITLQSNGAFFTDSLGGDLMAKVASGQEGKGAPPGIHLIFALFGFWPVMPLLLLALPAIWADRASRETRFLIAWAVPFWLVFEAVPTKLLHYLLPIFPALALLAVRQFAFPVARPALWLKVVAGFTLLPGLVLGAALAVIAARGGASPAVVAMLAGAVALAALLLGYGFLQGVMGDRRSRFVLSLLCAGGIVHGAIFLSLPRMPQIWPSEAAADLLEDIADRQGCTRLDLTSFGYAEPSLVFRMGAETRLLPSDAPVEQEVKPGPCVAALRAIAPGTEASPVPVGCSKTGTVSGFAIGAGRPVVLEVLECRGEG